MHQFTKLLKEAPPVKWNSIVGPMMEVPLSEVSLELLHEAIETARLAAYVNHRSLGQDHAHAVKASNRAVEAVAKAIGFTYRKSRRLSF